jgi:hypothetical protein
MVVHVEMREIDTKEKKSFHIVSFFLFRRQKRFSIEQKRMEWMGEKTKNK